MATLEAPEPEGTVRLGTAARRGAPAASIAEAAGLIAAGQLSPAELTEECLKRAEALQPSLLAFVALDAEGARSAAAELTAELARGVSRGPLHGIPVAVKDLIDVAGMPTGAGSAAVATGPAREDAAVVARLRGAGAVLIGKTRTHEFGLGVTTPPARNPWDLARSPGGSSGGSAVAVAVGACLGAVGSDTAGSIRIPAALCGVSGLKPRPRALSRKGVAPLAPSADSVGPLARSAQDLALLWNVLADAPGASPAGRRDPSPAGLRLGVPSSRRALGEIHPDVAERVDAALRRMREAGVVLVPVDLPPFSDWAPLTTLTLAEALDSHRRAGWWPGRAESYGQEARSYLLWAEARTVEQVGAARRRVRELSARFRAALSGLDALALPTVPTIAPEREDPPSAERQAALVRELTRLCGPVNWCDLAAVSVPCGLSGEGLPVGLQLIAHDERGSLAVGLALQSVTDFHRQHPPYAPAADLRPEEGSP